MKDKKKRVYPDGANEGWMRFWGTRAPGVLAGWVIFWGVRVPEVLVADGRRMHPSPNKCTTHVLGLHFIDRCFQNNNDSTTVCTTDGDWYHVEVGLEVFCDAMRDAHGGNEAVVPLDQYSKSAQDEQGDPAGDAVDGASHMRLVKEEQVAQTHAPIVVWLPWDRAKSYKDSLKRNPGTVYASQTMGV